MTVVSWFVAALCLQIPLLDAQAPPVFPEAQWHVSTRCSEGDVNAFFEYKGVWHVMHQAELRPRTSISHSVSTDLLNWYRQPNALESGNTGIEQCFDGGPSLIEKDGVLQPMLVIDGGCGELPLPVPGKEPCMETMGNGTGGVIAFPVDLNDPNLTQWRREGPITVHQCDGSAGPSQVWKNGDKYNMLMIHGKTGTEARFESTDPSLLEWRLADEKFLDRRGGGGGLWHELPPNVEGVDGGRWATHIFQENGGGDGRPWFALGVYDPVHETFANATQPQAVDIGGDVAYGQLSLSSTDSRKLHISWLVDKVRGKPAPPHCETGGQLTSIRDVRYDPRLNRLVENPIVEYTSLRRDALLSFASTLQAEQPRAIVFQGNESVVMDIEASVLVPQNFTQGAVTIGLRCTDGDNCTQGATLGLAIGAPAASGGRTIAMTVRTPTTLAKTSYPLLAGETTLPLRIMSDRRSIEIFTGAGRGVFSGTLYSQAGWITASSAQSDVSFSATGWAMAPIALTAATPKPVMQYEEVLV